MTLHKGKQEPFLFTNASFNNKSLRQATYSVDRPSGLRRVVSTRTLSPHIDSSESLPSEHSSLCDAVLTSYESEHTNARSIRARDDGGVGLAISNHVNELHSWDLERLRRRERPAVPSLETILEGHSVSTHGAASSRSRLRPCASVSVSLLSKTSSSPASSATSFRRRNQYGSKIYSFDDQDLPSFRPKFSFTTLPSERRHSCSTFSSEEGFEMPNWLNDIVSPAEPTQPIHPPPVRPSTPPGIPSFGSLEAINYDMSSLPRRNPRIIQSTRGTTPSTLPTSGSAATDSPDSNVGCCAFMRRFFSETSSYINYQPPPPLPPGVLARADDGTMVRGRFGARASGHGIGASGSLENHPFHRGSLPAARSKDANVRAPPPARTRNPRYRAVNEFGMQQQPPRVSSTNFSTPVPRYRSLLDDHGGPPSPSISTRQPPVARPPSNATPPRLRRQMLYNATDRNVSAGVQNKPGAEKIGFQRLWDLVSFNVAKRCCGLGVDGEPESRRDAEMQQVANIPSVRGQ